MVRNIVVLGGSSHPHLTEMICNQLGIPPAKILLGKFSVGETRVEIGESVRGKDVYIIQSGGGAVNDHFIELLITISACKTASAKRVSAVLPLFPYSRQSDIPYSKKGTPFARVAAVPNGSASDTFDSRPQTPYPHQPHATEVAGQADKINKKLSQLQLSKKRNPQPAEGGFFKPQDSDGIDRRDTLDSYRSDKSDRSDPSQTNGVEQEDIDGIMREEEVSVSASEVSKTVAFQPLRGYKQWVAQAGTLVADLLTCAGADHIITMDLHDAQYQGFFDIPVDNLYGRHLLRRHIQYKIPKYQQAVIVSPDAGGAKRATAIADALGMPFALIHKERRPTRITDRQNATMMLVGDVAYRTTILIDDLADTANTITRAARLLKKEGATEVYALVTHGVLSGDAIDRINASAIDRLVVTNSIDQSENLKRCPKLEVLEVGHVFAEAIRRVHHGESISVLFQYD